MGDLSQLTGTSVEATSELAATFELLGIKSEGLTKVIKSMTAQGLQPTMENIRKLAAEYQAIQDPVEKNEFLFKRFGKQAGDIAEILGKSTEELDKFTAAARTSGKVIDEETAAKAEKLNQQLAILKQRADGFAISAGNFVIPSIVGLFEGMDELTAAAQRGDISWLEYANRLSAVATGHGTAATLTQGLTTATQDLVHDTDRLTTPTTTAGLAINAYSIEVVSAAQNNYDAAAAAAAETAALDAQNIAAATLAGGMKELTTQTLFNQAAAGLDSVAALQLARDMGLVDDKAADAATKIAELKIKYDENRDGAIDAAEAAKGYAAEILTLARQVTSLPDTKVVTIKVVTQGDIGQLIQSGPGAVVGNQITTRRAAGGPFSAGGAVIMNESPATRPEVIVANPQGGGFILTKQDAQAALAGAGGSVTNNYYLNVSTSASLGGVSNDFALMKALSGA